MTTRADIIAALAGNAQHPTMVSAIATVDTVFGMMTAAIRRGEPVRIAGLGTFAVKNVPEHPGTNPRTGEAITISARRLVKFSAAKALLG